MSPDAVSVKYVFGRGFTPTHTGRTRALYCIERAYFKRKGEQGQKGGGGERKECPEGREFEEMGKGRRWGPE